MKRTIFNKTAPEGAKFFPSSFSLSKSFLFPSAQDRSAWGFFAALQMMAALRKSEQWAQRGLCILTGSHFLSPVPNSPLKKKESVCLSWCCWTGASKRSLLCGEKGDAWESSKNYIMLAVVTLLSRGCKIVSGLEWEGRKSTVVLPFFYLYLP